MKNRLSSYFSSKKDIKTRILVSRATSIDYITTENEYEALLLENTLIKRHHPVYNIDLKDDKSYPVLRITNEDFPRVLRTRKIIQDGSTYFGPFPNVAALDAFMETLFRLYKVRRCKTLRKRDSPCLYFHIHRCSAPCCGKIQKETYQSFIGEILQLLEDSDGKEAKKIEIAMKEAAKNLEFEKAARLRDGLAAIKVLKAQNTVEDFDETARDYVAFYAEGEMVSFVVLKMRNGKLVAKECYRTVSLKEPEELMEEFLPAFYTEKNLLPPQIFVPTHSNVEMAKNFFKETFNAKIKIAFVSENSKAQKRHAAAMAMARQNAREDIIRRKRERGDIPAMKELMSLLSLPTLPVRIEGFDIAHLEGKFPVASLISFYNGNPDKKNYRYFRLKSTEGVIDDFASMREASRRRYSRLLRENGELPDLILIDGGIGQVNAVQGVLAQLDLAIPVVGLAKRDEELYLPGNSRPICLPKRSDALRLLQRVRDETHRFATGANRKLRTKEKITSSFENLPNVGPKRAQILMKTFATTADLAVAEPQSVYSVLKCSPEMAEKIISAAKKSAE